MCVRKKLIVEKYSPDGERRVRVRRNGDGVHAHRRVRLLSLHTVGVRVARLLDPNGSGEGLRGERRWCSHAAFHEDREVHPVLGRGADAVRHAVRGRKEPQRETGR